MVRFQPQVTAAKVVEAGWVGEGGSGWEWLGVGVDGSGREWLGVGGIGLASDLKLV